MCSNSLIIFEKKRKFVNSPRVLYPSHVCIVIFKLCNCIFLDHVHVPKNDVHIEHFYCDHLAICSRQSEWQMCVGKKKSHVELPVRILPISFLYLFVA